MMELTMKVNQASSRGFKRWKCEAYNFIKIHTWIIQEKSVYLSWGVVKIRFEVGILFLSGWTFGYSSVTLLRSFCVMGEKQWLSTFKTPRSPTVDINIPMPSIHMLWFFSWFCWNNRLVCSNLTQARAVNTL